METKYTLKQAAELLGMTKPGVRYHLKTMGETFEKDAKGQVVVSESVLQRIRDGMEPESVPESSLESRKLKPESAPERDVKLSGVSESEPESTPESERKVESDDAITPTLSILREQLAVKDAQIAEKDRQIAQLTEALSTAQRTIESSQRALEASQALHAATVKQLQESTVKPIIQDEPAPERKAPDEEEPEGRRWFIPDDEDEDEDPPAKKKRSFLDWLLGRG